MKCLNEFTMEQMHKYGILSNGTKTFYTWDMHAGEWKKVEKTLFILSTAKNCFLFLKILLERTICLEESVFYKNYFGEND